MEQSQVQSDYKFPSILHAKDRQSQEHSKLVTPFWQVEEEQSQKQCFHETVPSCLPPF